jgi:hypothetical protein
MIGPARFVNSTKMSTCEKERNTSKLDRAEQIKEDDDLPDLVADSDSDLEDNKRPELGTGKEDNKPNPPRVELVPLGHPASSSRASSSCPSSPPASRRSLRVATRTRAAASRRALSRSAKFPRTSSDRFLRSIPPRRRP